MVKKLFLSVIFVGLVFIWGGYTILNSKLRSPPFLVIDLDGDGVEIIPLEDSKVYFDVDGDGLAERTAWVHPDDAFVFVMDKEERSTKRRMSWVTAVLTNLIPKLIRNDLNNDRIYDHSDFPESAKGKKSRGLGIYISTDKNLTGIKDFEYKNLVPCVYDAVSFTSSKKLTLSCANDKVYNLSEVRFEYEDSNVIWKAMCERWSSHGSRDKQDGLVCD